MTTYPQDYLKKENIPKFLKKHKIFFFLAFISNLIPPTGVLWTNGVLDDWGLIGSLFYLLLSVVIATWIWSLIWKFFGSIWKFFGSLFGKVRGALSKKDKDDKK